MHAQLKDGTVAEGKGVAMERHIQTIIVAVCVLLVGWVGLSITTLKESSIRQEGSMAVLTSQLVAMREQLKLASEDRYSATQAQADFRYRDLKIDSIESRTSALEQATMESTYPKSRSGAGKN